MANFPTSLPSDETKSASDTLAAAGHTAHHNKLDDETLAIATKMGTGSSTPASGTVLRGTGAGTSSWGAVVLTTDVTGVLPQGNGGTGTTSATGSGAAVYATSPTISAPALSNPTITGGGSWGGSPTITSPVISDFTNANHDHGDTNDGGPLAQGSVDGTMLSTSAITLGYEEITTDFSTGTTGSDVDITGLSVAVTVPAGGRRIRIQAFASSFSTSAGAGTNVVIAIKEGATQLSRVLRTAAQANDNIPLSVFYSAVVGAGSHTYKVALNTGVGTTTVGAGATYPAFILVEAI